MQGKEIILVGFDSFEVQKFSLIISKFEDLEYVAATDNSDMAVPIYRSYHPSSVIVNLDTPYGVNGVRVSIDLYKNDKDVNTILILPNPLFPREGMFLKLLLGNGIIKRHIFSHNMNPEMAYITSITYALSF
jgi:hypothetical protein